MITTQTTGRIEREIVRLCHSGLEAPALLQQAAQRVRSVIPYDAYCWGTIDPGTLLVTSKVAQDFPEISPARFAEHEYLIDDVNKLSALAGKTNPVGILGQITEGEPRRSPRYRGILSPFGLEREMRAALVVDRACWGGANLFRRQGAPDFTTAEAAFMARLAPHLAQGLRVSLLLNSETMPAGSDSPGLVLFADDVVTAISPEAQRWLNELPEAGPKGGVVPSPVYEVAVRARAIAGDEQLPHRDHSPARLRVRTTAGRWLVLHGVRLGATGQTAVIVEAARRPELAPLLLQAYDLSPREAEVVRLVLGGRSTAEIANALFVSPFTVQDHLKAVFAKIGVRSRRELVARLLGEQSLFSGKQDESGSGGQSVNAHLSRSPDLLPIAAH